MVNPQTLKEVLEVQNLNLSTNPKGTDKGDYKSYVPGFYEKDFQARKNKKNRILEVGVRTGASMSLWANYFENAEIIGLDIEPAGSAAGPLLAYLDYPSVKFLCENAYDRKIADSITGEFTVLIDDGPHSLESQKVFIELYLSKLAKDGVLIIEDIQGGFLDCCALMAELPSSYNFEIHDFRKWTNTYDNLLFIVRHHQGSLPMFFKRGFYRVWGALVLVRNWFKMLVDELSKFSKRFR
jgi:hypothetical protein